jgi:hypothetical protein
MDDIDKKNINDIIDQIIIRFTTYLGTKERNTKNAKIGLEKFIKIIYEDNVGYNE